VPPALNYRLQGHNYAAIGKHLGVTANAVQKDVVKALRDFIKPETAHAVLAMELTRLDAMQAAVYAEAINGDTGAIDTCLKIINQRQRLTSRPRLVQPFAIIEEKACLVSNQGISGNFVPISGELAKTWTLPTALSR